MRTVALARNGIELSSAPIWYLYYECEKQREGRLIEKLATTSNASSHGAIEAAKRKPRKYIRLINNWTAQSSLDLPLSLISNHFKLIMALPFHTPIKQASKLESERATVPIVPCNLPNWPQPTQPNDKETRAGWTKCADCITRFIFAITNKRLTVCYCAIKQHNCLLAPSRPMILLGGGASINLVGFSCAGQNASALNGFGPPRREQQASSFENCCLKSWILSLSLARCTIQVGVAHRLRVHSL